MLEDLNQKDNSLNQSTSFTSKVQGYIRSRYGTNLLAFISLLEGLFPIPLIVDPFLVVAIMVNRIKVIKLVVITTATSVIGGLGAFYTAIYFKDWLLSVLSPEAIETLQTFIGSSDGTFILTLLGAVTPIPYTIVAWAVAISGGNPLVFIIASIVGRGMRFSIVGWSTYMFGPIALRYAKRSILATSLILFIFVALYVWLKL